MTIPSQPPTAGPSGGDWTRKLEPQHAAELLQAVLNDLLRERSPETRCRLSVHPSPRTAERHLKTIASWLGNQNCSTVIQILSMYSDKAKIALFVMEL